MSKSDKRSKARDSPGGYLYPITAEGRRVRLEIGEYVIYDKADVERYFEEIAFEPQLHTDTRIHAGSICTRFNMLREMGKYQGFLRIRNVAFEAVKKYFMEKDSRINPQHVVNISNMETADDLAKVLSGQQPMGLVEDDK